MTRKQLYLSGNSLWARSVDFYAIDTIRRCEKHLTREEIWKQISTTENGDQLNVTSLINSY